MTTITFSKPAAYFVWAVYGLFGKRQECYACGQHVTPRNVGAFRLLDDGSMGVWHGRLPCILALKNIDHSSEIAARIIANGK